MGMIRDLERIAPAWREVPALHARVRDLETTVVNHPNHTATLARIEKLHSRWSPPGTAKRLDARFLLVVGESGAGKSTAVKAYHARFPVVRLEDVADGMIGGKPVPQSVVDRLQDGDIMRVVRVEAPKGRTTERAFVAAMFQSLGYKVPEHWNTDEIIRKLRQYADELGVELFLIDEGHHIVPRSDQDDTGTIDFLKSLLNRLQIPIVIAGLSRLLRLQQSLDDRQMGMRGKGAVILAPYNWWSADGRTKVMGYIKRLEGQFGLPEPSGLWEQENALRIYVATVGEPGWIAKYLSEALELALDRGLGLIDMKLLGEVHETLLADEQEAVPELDFFAVVSEDDLEAKKKSEAKDNPFLCGRDELKSLWDRRHETLERRRDVDAANRADRPAEPVKGRKTGLRGNGRGPVKVFGGQQ